MESVAGVISAVRPPRLSQRIVRCGASAERKAARGDAQIRTDVASCERAGHCIRCQRQIRSIAAQNTGQRSIVDVQHIGGRAVVDLAGSRNAPLTVNEAGVMLADNPAGATST